MARRSEDMMFLKRATLAGIGCALLPLYSVQQELDNGELQRLLPSQRARVSAWGDQLYLLTAPNLYPTLATRTLIEFLHSRLQVLLPI